MSSTKTPTHHIKRARIEGIPRVDLPPAGHYRVFARTSPVGDYPAESSNKAAMSAFDQAAVNGTMQASFLVLSSDGVWEHITVRLNGDK